ncbi:DNA mismatch repair protein Mlh1 [Bacillus rossius redtenbacheri]|uniref:DNA mismatch repair protein Mlh1 n=1 Tax=Bacillus rossius redtenbacheri TaxID=93214 RepID=UPI002FDE33DD
MCSAGRIRRLKKCVVDKIAAGEVIQRPANAIKELIENCLDAKATSIQITVQSGGLKLIQLQDNGTGILKNDLEIICERFTTSKLSDFDDLATVSTYGFRGEALTSISHVSHLTIKTKVAEEDCGYKAVYLDGKLVGKLTPCAMNQGTQITVQDLFYNVPSRSKVLKNESEEFSRIWDVVSSYAVHNAHVAFTLKKQGENVPVIRTQGTNNPVDNIRTIHGNNVAKELLMFEENSELLNFKVKGYLTKPNYSAKKLTVLLFVNNRQVESTGIRKGVEEAYRYYFEKDCHPFFYIKLDVDPRIVDVNVHPTKHEVIILHERAIVDKIKSCVTKALSSEAGDSLHYTQALLPGASEPPVAAADKPKLAPQHMVRTDSTAQTLDKFVVDVRDATSSTNTTPVPKKQNSSQRREIRLTSVLELKEDIRSKLHVGLRDIVKNSTFVGCISPRQAVIQHETKLYLCNTEQLSLEMFYQIMVYDFGNLGLLRFEQPISLKDLARIAVDSREFGWKETDGTKEDVAEGVADLLTQHAAMLEDYFSTVIDPEGRLQGIPLLLDGFCPDEGGLPTYVVRLSRNVNWKSEKKCFETFCRETARFYSEQLAMGWAAAEVLDKARPAETTRSHWSWVVEHVVYPALKRCLLPPKEFAENATILEIANLPQIFKVFERC